VAWIGVEPTPYHLPLLKELCASERLELEVFFCARQVNQRWQVSEDYQRLTAALPSTRSYRLGGLYFNPSILQALRRKPWDAVVLGGYAHWTMRAAIALALVRRIPFLILSDSQRLRRRSWATRWAKRALLFPWLRQCGAAIGVGRLACDYWRYVGVPPERIFTVPYPSHLEQFQIDDARRGELRRQTRRELGIAEGELIGLYVGRLDGVKGVDLLLEGQAQLPAAERPRLLIVGDGPQREALQASAARLALPVQFLGFRQNTELLPLYAAADFFVLPSRDEPWGIVVSEAMAAGLPAVLSDQVGAAYDLLDEPQNGYWVRGGQPADWAAALQRCVRQRAALPAMGRQSQAIVAAWTCAAGADQFMQALNAALPPDKATSWASP